MRILLSLCLLSTLACGDDDSSFDGGPALDGGADGSLDTGVIPDVGPADSGPDPDAGPSLEFAALVRGTLFTDDLGMAKDYHDPLASGGEETARMLGDFAHDVHLGTTLLGTTQDEFVAVDRWTSLEGAMGFYSNPDFMEAFGMLFSEAPSLGLFERTEWHQWGDMDVADELDAHFRVVVRGRLRAAPESVQADHDGVAAAGEESATAAGDLAHIVYLGVEDPREFLAFDIWGSDANIEAFYGNPDFQAAFGALFESPPTVAVVRSTDWHQW